MFVQIPLKIFLDALKQSFSKRQLLRFQIKLTEHTVSILLNDLWVYNEVILSFSQYVQRNNLMR